jgi:hypothetical protein
VVRTGFIMLSLALLGLTQVAAASAAERPAVRGFSISPARFAAAGAGRGGTKVHFRLSKRATVAIAVVRRLPGRVSSGRCVKPRARLAHRRHCTRRVSIGRLAYGRQRAGRHTHAFHGRVGGHRLRPGIYGATIVAVDRRHRRSRPHATRFRILRATSGSPSPGPSPGPAPAPSPSPGPNVFPNPSNTGVPAGWAPAATRSSDMDVNTAGAVVQDIRFTNGANLNINAPNVTVQRVELQGGSIGTEKPGVVIRDTTIDRASPETNGGEGVISSCGYTAIRVAILDRNEGFREGGGCSADTPTTIQDSFVRITPPEPCGDWHGDGVQGYQGQNLHVTNLTIDFHETSSCTATSPFFYVGGSGGSPDGHAVINGLLLKGGGYSFRMGTPGSVQGLKIVDGSWRYGPIDITDSGCGAISPWEAQIVNVDANWQVTRNVRSLRCTNSG